LGDLRRTGMGRLEEVVLVLVRCFEERYTRDLYSLH
jgi:hypothetical protein